MDWLGSVDSLHEAEFEFWLVWVFLSFCVLALIVYRLVLPDIRPRIVDCVVKPSDLVFGRILCEARLFGIRLKDLTFDYSNPDLTINGSELRKRKENIFCQNKLL